MVSKFLTLSTFIMMPVVLLSILSITPVAFAQSETPGESSVDTSVRMSSIQMSYGFRQQDPGGQFTNVLGWAPDGGTTSFTIYGRGFTERYGGTEFEEMQLGREGTEWLNDLSSLTPSSFVVISLEGSRSTPDYTGMQLVICAVDDIGPRSDVNDPPWFHINCNAAPESGTQLRFIIFNIPNVEFPRATQ
jgi:hypothetical protein